MKTKVEAARLDKARELVREVVVKDMGQSISKRKLNEVAETIVRALPKVHRVKEGAST